MAENRFIKVGLTGGIGSGKSAVSSILKDKGIPIVDADLISRDILKTYPEISQRIKEVFGEEFFCGEVLNRKKLGKYVFGNKAERKKLEDIMIPYIKKEIFKSIEECRQRGESLCVVDAPTLMEHNLHMLMDYNIVVWVDKKTQIERVKKRDSLSDEEVIDRINAQIPLEEKIKIADFVIDNTGSIADTEIKIKEILHSIRQ